jgi:hypothetical protein
VKKGKRTLANIKLTGTIPLNGGLFFALDNEGNGRLHNNDLFFGYTTSWFTNARGQCVRVRVFGGEKIGGLKPATLLCDTQQDAILTLIRLAQTGRRK